MPAIPAIKTLAVLVVAAVIICCAVYIGMKPPFGKPDEKTRVHHPAGFSIVKPENWSHDPVGIFDGNLSKPYTIAMIENKPAGMPSSLSVTRRVDRPKETTIEPSNDTFQGRPAWKKLTAKRKSEVTSLCFEVDGSWFAIIYDAPPTFPFSDISPFVDTFRLDIAAVSQTQPAGK